MGGRAEAGASNGGLRAGRKRCADRAAAGCAVVLELGGAVLRIAADAPPALVAAVVRSLRR